MPPLKRRRLAAVLIAATAALVGLVVFGAIVERRSRTPLIQVGLLAPELMVCYLRFRLYRM